MARFWPHRETAPALWTVFCADWLGLSRTKTEQWWQVLSASGWLGPAAVAPVVLAQEGLRLGDELVDGHADFLGHILGELADFQGQIGLHAAAPAVGKRVLQVPRVTAPIRWGIGALGDRAAIGKGGDFLVHDGPTPAGLFEPR